MNAPQIEGAASAAPTAWLAECRERAPGFAQAFSDQQGQGKRVLAEPGCARRCNRCVRECATRYIVADWWARELAQAESEVLSTTASGRTFYSTQEGRA